MEAETAPPSDAERTSEAMVSLCIDMIMKNVGNQLTNLESRKEMKCSSLSTEELVSNPTNEGSKEEDVAGSAFRCSINLFPSDVKGEGVQRIAYNK